MGSNNEMKTQLNFDDPEYKKSNSSRCWMLLCGTLLLVSVAALVGVVVWHVITVKHGKENECSTRHCVKTAGKILEKIDFEVDPCDNFYDFACGGWLKKTVIPEDTSRYDLFRILDDELQVVLKELFQRKKTSDDIEVITKVRDLYASCLDLDTIERRDKQPLVQMISDLGGWPVLGENDGGSWNETEFNLENLIGRLLGDFGSSVIVSCAVGVDDKNSSRHVLWVGQPGLGMGSREYYLDDDYTDRKQAYLDYMVRISTMLGADEATAKADMADVLEYETLLANISSRPEEMRDSEKLYNPTTIADLNQDVPHINWTRYFDIVMPDEMDQLPSTQLVINQAPAYIANASKITSETSARVIANYLIWRITMTKMSYLSQEFRNAKQEYDKVLLGTTSVSARWRECVKYANGVLKFATGRMYVEEKFDDESKTNIEKMVANLKTTFKDMLEYNDWMDEETKIVAREKCDAIQEHIGYPDWIKDDESLNAYYTKVGVTKDKYFENVQNVGKWKIQKRLLRLHKPVDKDEWFLGPAVINAFYSSSRNSIFFPAGILQPPFYHADSPSYLNYGGIGMVTGHEITHGFDDRGRQYDKDGNLKQWWNDQSIANFKESTQCIIDQYDEYLMPENNKTLNGIQTQGENIADNGGLRQALKAYMENEYSDVKLPGFHTYTPKQLFYINFAQMLCSAARPQSVDASILSASHSPGRYRVIGPIQNTIDFSDAFDCPDNSYMSPPTENKCIIW